MARTAAVAPGDVPEGDPGPLRHPLHPGPPVSSDDTAGLHDTVLHWYDANRRELPWRSPGVSAWAVLVSEVMLQQTPVRRVLPLYETWLARWPTPAALAAEPSGAAVRAWGRLGYPRRALRLHAAATVCRDRHGDRVPRTMAEIRALPGVGEYTAAAVAAFAYRDRALVLDTNVRRVLGRLLAGAAHPPAAVTAAERARAAAVLPADPSTAARWSVGLMELGALVCTARTPRCADCPLESRCRWAAAGRPGGTERARPAQAWVGTDRQARGRLLAVLRGADAAVPVAVVRAAWDGAPTAASERRAADGDPATWAADRAAQAVRALSGLVADGLVEGDEHRGYALVGTLSSAGTRQVARVAKGSGL